jgi:hypothetical protein
MDLSDLTNAFLLINSVPESLSLLILGVCLVGATVGLRRLMRRFQAEKTEKSLSEKPAAKH